MLNEQKRQQKREYMRNYRKVRYENDPLFKERLQQDARERARIKRLDPAYKQKQQQYAQLPERQEYNRSYQEQLRRKRGQPTREDLKKEGLVRLLQTATKLHNNKYSYDNVVYVDIDTKVSILCPIHGEFCQTPYNHMNGQGCPRCASLIRKEKCGHPRKSQQEFIDEANAIHANKYDYSLTEYTNIKSKITIVCPDHGSFTQEAKAHLRGQGCPLCANERRLSFFQSKGETLIEQCLMSSNIKFEKQKMFKDCKFKMVLRFDFYLPNLNILIEFDGEQHFVFVKKFHKTIETFHNLQQRDKIKTDYAINNNIRLIRIRFNQQKNIQQILSAL